MRRSTVLLLAALALVLAACQIRTDYGLRINADTSAELAFEISYDSEAAELFGPAEAFLEEEVETDVGDSIEGVTLVETSADSSDPENQRVSALFAAEDGAALDRLVADLFPGSSFTNTSGTTWELTLRSDEDVASDFGEEIPLDDIVGEFLAGEVRVAYAGTQVSMQGGTDDGSDAIVWNPYSGEDLQLVVELSGSAPPPAPEEDEPEDPADEDASADEEPATDDPTDDPTDDDSTPDEDPIAEPEATEGEAAVTITDDGDGLSLGLLAAIAAGALLLLLLLVLLLRGRRRGGDADRSVPATADAGGWAPPSAPTQQPPTGGLPSSTAPTQQLPPAGPAGAPPAAPGTPPPPPPGTTPPPGNAPPPPPG
jgi:hypothetical protein